jgi:hypothetical protein
MGQIRNPMLYPFELRAPRTSTCLATSVYNAPPEPASVRMAHFLDAYRARCCLRSYGMAAR